MLSSCQPSCHQRCSTGVFYWPCSSCGGAAALVLWMVPNSRLERNRQGIYHISGWARLNVIRAGNHLLQKYNLLLIAIPSLYLTMTNDCISEPIYRCLPRLIPPVLQPNLFQRDAASGPNVSHITRLAANLTCQYVSGLIHQLMLYAFLSQLSFIHIFITERLDFQFQPLGIWLWVLNHWQSAVWLKGTNNLNNHS